MIPFNCLPTRLPIVSAKLLTIVLNQSNTSSLGYFKLSNSFLHIPELTCRLNRLLCVLVLRQAGTKPRGTE